ncbi:MAG TPA: alpha-1,2-fucosyltransferase [Bacteroidia bacterium]|nr:alpha-1,2-fucosyltransferase [Bacteroidia bacterium]
MIVVRFTGGLGNQMFQYALGTHLAIKNKTELLIDTTLLLDHSNPHEIVTHRNLDIDIFNVKLNIASQHIVEKFNGKQYNHVLGKMINKVQWQFKKKNLIVEHVRNFNPDILQLSDNKCLVGAWQSEKYFKAIEKEIREQFTFKNALSGATAELGKKIQNENSLCINVRRGDYVTSPIYSKTLGTMPLQYFMKGYEYHKSKNAINHIFIFSDDLVWCKANFNFDIPHTFVEHEFAGARFSNYLQLMSMCKHFIIPNSTFAWWGAWLSPNKDKIVMAPKNWFADNTLNCDDIIPKQWIKF